MPVLPTNNFPSWVLSQLACIFHTLCAILADFVSFGVLTPVLSALEFIYWLSYACVRNQACSHLGRCAVWTLFWFNQLLQYTVITTAVPTACNHKSILHNIFAHRAHHFFRDIFSEVCTFRFMFPFSCKVRLGIDDWHGKFAFWILTCSTCVGIYRHKMSLWDSMISLDDWPFPFTFVPTVLNPVTFSSTDVAHVLIW